jgi:hypothetical protein
VPSGKNSRLPPRARAVSTQRAISSSDGSSPTSLWKKPASLGTAPKIGTRSM